MIVDKMTQKRNLLDFMLQICNIIYTKCAFSALLLIFTLYSGCKIFTLAETHFEGHFRSKTLWICPFLFGYSNQATAFYEPFK